MAVDVGTADGARAGPGDQQHLQLTQDGVEAQTKDASRNNPQVPARAARIVLWQR
jgi:hypothetical protein